MANQNNNILRYYQNGQYIPIDVRAQNILFADGSGGYIYVNLQQALDTIEANLKELNTRFDNIGPYKLVYNESMDSLDIIREKQ